MNNDDILSMFDPVRASPARAQPNLPQSDEQQFASLCGVDLATAAVHINAARARGAGLEEAVDAFYSNGGAHVRPDPAPPAPRPASRSDAEVDADAAFARALAEEDKDRSGRTHAIDEIVRQLEDMGFGKAMALDAAQECKTLEDATHFCLNGGVAPSTMAAAPQAMPVAVAVPDGAPPRPTGGPAARARAQGRPALQAVAREQPAGARWQKRTFALRNCELGYGPNDAAAQSGEAMKGVPIWGCYALKEPPHQGKDHVFAVYSGADGGPGAPRATLAMLAADDAATCAEWLRAVYAASGRTGMLLRVGDDAVASTLLCVCAAEPGDVSANFEAGGNATGKVVVSRCAGGLARVGVRVGDELTALDGNPLPYMEAAPLGRLLATARRPFELTIRRPRNAPPAGGAAPSARPVAAPQESEIDLLGLDTPTVVEPVRSFDFDAAAAAAAAAAAPLPPRAARRTPPAATRGPPSPSTAPSSTRLEAQPLYAADAATRERVAARFPGVSLAALYDAAVANVRDAEAKAAAAAAPPPPRAPEPYASPPPQQQYAPAPPQHQYAPQQQPPPPQHVDPFAELPPAAAPPVLSVGADEDLLLIETHADGWSDVVKADGARGMVPASYIVPK
ncbi:hypothetical protein JL720_1876 [Aureococcus anophagefferens]|nr:hypothetical protein JL720_1876 [Aureococcus anophagefferens]